MRITTLPGLAQAITAGLLTLTAAAAAGTVPDCNDNGRDDAVDLAVYAEWDCNANGLPDACERTRLPALDDDGDGVLDECVPRYRLRDLVTVFGLPSNGLRIEDVSETGLAVASRGGPHTLLNLQTFAQTDLGLPPQVYVGACVNNAGLVGGAYRDGNEVVVVRASLADPQWTEVTRYEHVASSSLHSVRALGLTDAGLLLIQQSSLQAFVGGVWQNRVTFVDLASGARQSSTARMSPTAATRDGRAIARVWDGEIFDPDPIRALDAHLAVLDTYDPLPQPNPFDWAMPREAPSASGFTAIAIRDDFGPWPNQIGVLLPASAEVDRLRRLDADGHDRWDSSAYVTDTGSVVAASSSSGGTVWVWPTPEFPAAAFRLENLLSDAPEGQPDDWNAVTFGLDHEGMTDNGLITFSGGGSNAWFAQPLPTVTTGIDLDGSTIVDAADLLLLTNLVDGLGGDPVTDPDVNRDGALDEQDAVDLHWWLLGARADTLPDCNGNGIPDLAELARFGGTLADDDGDLVPDVCEAVCAAAADLVDTGGSAGVVDFADLLALLGCWGPAAGECVAADIASPPDGQVDFADLLALLTCWARGG